MPDYRIIVDLSDHMLYLLDGDQVVKGYPVAIGKMLTETPTGNSRSSTNRKIPEVLSAFFGWACRLRIMAFMAQTILRPLANRCRMAAFACIIAMCWIFLPKLA